MRVLVTGGGGFVGGAVVRRLLHRGDAVRSFSRQRYPDLDALGVESMEGDLADEGAVAAAIAGCDAVVHVAAKAGVWGSYEDYFKTNVLGTRSVLAGCRQHGVTRLVYTSTPSVTFKGRDEDGVDESEPYATRFLCHYAATKTQAEKEVLAANSDALATVALRPHLVWGPGDNHLVPRILDRARQGRLRIVGSGRNRVDSVYIDNAAEAHLCALDCLSPGSACAGKAYFISNGEPLAMQELLNRILAAGGLVSVDKHVPVCVAYAARTVLEALYRLTGRRDEPMMTRFVARQLSTAHWFDISAGRRDLGYEPRVSIAEGLERLAQHLAGPGTENDER